MKGIKIECSEDHLKNVEEILFQASFNTKPVFDLVHLETQYDDYYYGIREEFGKWYIVTD